MSDRIAPLKLGSRVKFLDRWAGRLAAFEVTEGWEVLNIVLDHGGLSRAAVRLPLSAATDWTEGTIACSRITADQAFARTVPPVAVPARPLSAGTPIAVAGARLSGALIDTTSHKAAALLIRAAKRSGDLRVGVEHVSFEGKVMTLAVQIEALLPHRTDEELLSMARDALLRAPGVTGTDRRALTLQVDDGRVRVTGNVRTKQTRDAVERAAAGALNGVPVECMIADDIRLEIDVGQAIERAGLQRRADVFVRSVLGEVTLSGRAPSSGVAEEAVRVVSRVPGVRAVHNNLAIRSHET